MKLKELESGSIQITIITFIVLLQTLSSHTPPGLELQPLQGFASPKRELEQYVTNPHLAARMIFSAESSFGDIDEKHVLDLGCGCAVLSIACVMLGAESILSVDVDPTALSTAKENIASLEMEEQITLLHAQIGTLVTETGEPVKEVEGDGERIAKFDPAKLDREIDTVVMNPPFGTWNQGIDMVFLETACQVAGTAVYSLHKSSTRDFILKKAKTLGFEGEVLAEMKYALPKTMAFHKSKSVDIQVDFFRFERVRPKPTA
ncbi:S-adenosyl-L-methionine-dependent methyltransferase [Meredithblackwellia eburnea MCA 4105]